MRTRRRRASIGATLDHVRCESQRPCKRTSGGPCPSSCQWSRQPSTRRKLMFHTRARRRPPRLARGARIAMARQAPSCRPERPRDRRPISAAHECLSPLQLERSRGGRRGGAWQTDRKDRLSFRRLRVEGTPVRPRDLAGDVEPQAKVSGLRDLALLGAAERLEDERKHIRGDGLSLVADHDDDVRSVAIGMERHARPLPRVLDGIPGNVGDDVREPIGIQIRLHVPVHGTLDGDRAAQQEFAGDALADVAEARRAQVEHHAAPTESARRSRPPISM